MLKSTRNTWIIISLFFYCFSSVNGQSLESGPIDLTEEDGYWYIKHQISKGETLYSLSRMYKVSVQEIETSNPGTSHGIAINEFVMIPIAGEFIKHHVVQHDETLYSIAREYNASVQELRRWNSIKGNAIDIGQELQLFIFSNKKVDKDIPDASIHIVATGESLYGISQKYKVSVSDLKEWNDLESNNISIGQQLIVSGSRRPAPEGRDSKGLAMNDKEPAILAAVESTIVKVEGNSIKSAPHESPLNKFKKTEERGMAELIDGSTESAKYLALHRYAPKGTILVVRNELNNQVVFVRVIGSLPDTGVNNKVIVKISKVAWEKLGAVNKRFRVKVSYFQ